MTICPQGINLHKHERHSCSEVHLQLENAMSGKRRRSLIGWDFRLSIRNAVIGCHRLRVVNSALVALSPAAPDKGHSSIPTFASLHSLSFSSFLLLLFRNAVLLSYSSL
jgi:hypothetical protein